MCNLNVTEPGSSKRNLGNTLVKNVSYKYLQNCFGETFKYFSTPQSRHGPIYSNICVETDVSQSQIKENDDVIKRLLAEDVRFKALSATVHKVIRTDICKTLVLIPRQATWLAGCLQKHHLKYDFSKQNFTGGMVIESRHFYQKKLLQFLSFSLSLSVSLLPPPPSMLYRSLPFSPPPPPLLYI